MKLTHHQKKLLIECHPDRHNGDTSLLEKFFALVNKSREGLADHPNRCLFPGCGVAVSGLSRGCSAHWRALKRHMIGAMLLLAALTSNAATWYVSTAASGANNGTTWENAWENTTDINWASISAGDTIYLDGGASGLSYAAFNTITADGSAGNYITIAASTESGRNGIVTIATPFVVSGDYIKFQGNGYKLVSGTTYRCGIVFTCTGRTLSPVSYAGGQSINTTGLSPWFNYCYFNGSYEGADGSSLGHYGTSGMILTRCWFYQSLWQDQMTWEMTSPGGVFAITNCVFQDNNRPDRDDTSHRDIVNPFTGDAGYDLYVVNSMHFNTPGHASDQPQGDGFLLQDSYYAEASQLGMVYFANNISYDCGYFLRFGTANSGADAIRYYNNTIIANAQEADGYSRDERAYIAESQGTSGTFNDIAQDNLITSTTGKNFISNTSPLGADGIPFTDDDGFLIQAGSTAIDAGADVNVDTDIRGYTRTGTPDDGAYEFGATGGGGQSGSAWAVGTLRIGP